MNRLISQRLKMQQREIRAPYYGIESTLKRYAKKNRGVALKNVFISRTDKTISHGRVRSLYYMTIATDELVLVCQTEKRRNKWHYRVNNGNGIFGPPIAIEKVDEAGVPGVTDELVKEMMAIHGRYWERPLVQIHLAQHTWMGIWRFRRQQVPGLSAMPRDVALMMAKIIETEWLKK